MAEEIEFNFDHFENLNIVKRLKQIIGSWWNIQLNFTDEKGFLRGVPQGRFFNPKNPICKLITENNESFKDCVNVARVTTIESEEATIEIKYTNSIRITMPYLLGHIEFLFENVDIVSRVGIGEKQCNGEWSYFDLLSKKEFDFYYP